MAVGGYDRVLFVGYVGVASLCFMMIGWIWFAPGSCSTKYRASESEAAAFSDGFVPATLITKYRNHWGVCVAHVLPASVWSAIAPFQIHPAARRRFPTIHRYAGRIFLLISAIMTYGYYMIHQRDLHFHANDFPTIPRDEHTSLWLNYSAVPGASFQLVEHAGAAWFFYTAARSYLAVATSKRDFSSHRIWTWRHIAAGLGVALQRVFLLLHHVAFAAIGVDSRKPERMKAIFSDSLVLGGLFAAVYCEMCVRRLAISKLKSP